MYKRHIGGVGGRTFDLDSFILDRGKIEPTSTV